MKKLRRNGFITKVWNKKVLLIGVIGVILTVVCIGGYLISRDIRTEGTSYIKVGGFEVEYVLGESSLILEDFEQIELGCNLSDIEEKMGELDGWIGSGCSMPVFILQDETAMVCVFYDGFSEDLIKLEWYDGKGNSKVIKSKIEQLR